MSQSSREQYLESKVLTASQPQLHMMLLDGALRFGRQAQSLWEEGSDFAGIDPLLEKMSNIVDELTHGTAVATQEVSSQLEEQYAFVYRELATCRINQEPTNLETSLRLLEYQRETWRLAIEKLEADTNGPSTPAETKPTLPHMNLDVTQPTSGFSLEA